MSNIDKHAVQAVADLKAGYTLGHADVAILNELARIALASLEAKPIGAFHIADQQVDGTTDYIKDGEWPIDDGVIEVYTAPPAPVAVPDFGALTKCIVQRLVDYGAADDDAIASAEEFVYNACRDAMLNQDKSNG